MQAYLETETRERKLYAEGASFYFFVIFVHFLWAVSVPITKMGYAALGIDGSHLFSLFTFAGIRLTGAGAATLVFCRLRGLRLFPRAAREMWPLIKLGLLMSAVQYVLLYLGTALSSGVETSILISSGAFTGILISSLVFKEDRLTRRKILGCVLGLAAVVILNLHDIRSGMAVSVLGGLLVIASQAAGTLGAVYLKFISRGRSAVWIGAWQTFIGGAVLIFAGLAGGGRLNYTAGCGAGLPTVLLTLASILTLVISNQLYKYNVLSKVVIFTLLMPVFGTISSALILGESLASAAVLSSLAVNCVGVGLVTMEGKAREKAAVL